MGIDGGYRTGSNGCGGISLEQILDTIIYQSESVLLPLSAPGWLSPTLETRRQFIAELGMPSSPDP